METNYGVGNLAVVKYNDGGDRRDIVSARQFVLGVNVDFDDFDFVTKFLTDFVNNRGQHLTRPAPASPEIN